MTKHRSQIGHFELWRAGPASTLGVGDLMVESGYVPLSTGFARCPCFPLKTLFSRTFVVRLGPKFRPDFGRICVSKRPKNVEENKVFKGELGP